MGGCWSRTQRIVTGVYEMDCVSASIVAETICDAKSEPTYVPLVNHVEMVRGNPGEPGACWKERRMYGGREITTRKAITKLTKSDTTDTPFYEIALTMEVIEDARLSLIPHFFSTFTIVIEEKTAEPQKPPSCTIRWSYAFLATNIYASIVSTLCMKRLVNEFVAQLEQVMHCRYTEALRRTIRKSMDDEKA